MKKYFFVTMSLFCMIFFSAYEAHAEQPVKQLKNGVSWSDKMSETDEEKMYQINVAKTSQITLKTTSYIPYLFVSLENKKKEQMATNWNFEGATSKKSKTWSTSHYLLPGTYYVRVKKQSDLTGNFKLQVKQKVVKTNEIEPNNTLKKAQKLLPNNTKVTGLVGWNDTIDYYKVTNLKKFATLEVEVTSTMPTLSSLVMTDQYSVLMGNNVYGQASPSKPVKWKKRTRITKGTYYIAIQNNNWNFGKYIVTTRIPEMLPPSPTVKMIKVGARSVKGQSIHNSKITVKIKNKYYYGKTNKKGEFTIKIPKQTYKNKVYVRVTSQYGTSEYSKEVVSKK